MTGADGGEIVRVSSDGRITLSPSLCEMVGIETPGQVIVHEADGRLVVEPLPSAAAAQGRHAGRYESGTVSSQLRMMVDADRRLEDSQDARLGMGDRGVLEDERD